MMERCRVSTGFLMLKLNPRGGQNGFLQWTVKTGQDPHNIPVSAVLTLFLVSEYIACSVKLNGFPNAETEPERHAEIRLRENILKMSDKMLLRHPLSGVKCLTKAWNVWRSTTALSDKMSNECQKVFAKPEKCKCKGKMAYSLYQTYNWEDIVN